MFLQLTTAVFLLGVSNAVKFPSEWGPACKMGPKLSECVKISGAKALASLVKGNPSLGVLPLDPLHVETLNINQGNGPVSIDLKLTHTDISGIKAVVIQEVKTDWKELYVKLFMPKIYINGKYDIKGKILILPITGNGDCEISLDNFLSDGKAKFSRSINKGTGEEYYHMDSVDFSFNVTHASFRLENLFNGDERLGKQMNIFLNENWKEFLHELKPAIAFSLGEALREIANRVFSKIPVKEMTPP